MLMTMCMKSSHGDILSNRRCGQSGPSIATTKHRPGATSRLPLPRYESYDASRTLKWLRVPIAMHNAD